MKAFHGEPALQREFVKRMHEHVQLDQVIQGIYWSHGNGCFIGCAVHSDRAQDFEEHLGLPVSLAQIGEVIFEELSLSEAKLFVIEVAESIRLGVDYDYLLPAMLIEILSTLKPLPIVDRVRRVLQVWLYRGVINSPAAASASAASAASAYAAAAASASAASAYASASAAAASAAAASASASAASAAAASAAASSASYAFSYAYAADASYAAFSYASAAAAASADASYAVYWRYLSRQFISHLKAQPVRQTSVLTLETAQR